MPGLMAHYAPFPIDTPALRVQGLGVREVMRPCVFERPRGWPQFLFVVFYADTLCRTGTAGALRRVRAGTFVCWRPGTPHALGDAVRPWDHSWLSVGGSDVARALRETRFPTDSPRPLHDLSFFDAALAELFAELARPQDGVGARDVRLVRGYVVALVRRLARALRPGGRDAAVPAAVLEARRQMDTRFHEPLTLPSLADAAALSVSQLCLLHRRHFGTTVMAYLRDVRLRRAALLLRDSGLKVRSVGEAVGFPDHYHFSKTFRRQFGRPPATFRAWCGGDGP